MKKLILSLCCVLSLAACHKKPKAAAQPKLTKSVKSAYAVSLGIDPSEAPAVAVTVTAAAETPAVESTDARPLSPEEIERLRYIVYMFREEFGRYPSALTDLATSGMLSGFSAPISNNYIAYNPTTGTLASAK